MGDIIKTAKCEHCGCNVNYNTLKDVLHVCIESPSDIENLEIGKKYIICPKCYQDIYVS